MNDKRIDQLKKEYMDTPIPQELDAIIKETFREEKVKMKKQKNKSRLLTSAASIAAALAISIVGINTSPVIAENLGELPVIGSIVKVLTFREYKIDEEGYHGNIVTPEIEGLENKELEESLNKKYIDENKKLYEEFIVEVEDLKKEEGGHLGVASGYVVKTDTDEILSIGRYTVNTVGSSSTVFKYDTISKKDNILITLPSLFKDDSYIEIISENIKKQMIEQNKADENKIYWVEGINSDIKAFEEINADQSFFISEDNKLVISFDKYEVAPGSMGVIEFVIPTEVLSDILVSNQYIN